MLLVSHVRNGITKEHIATHTHLKFKALYSSTLVITLFTAVQSCLKLKLLL